MENIYTEYIEEIKQRESQGLAPKPIDNAKLLEVIINQI